MENTMPFRKILLNAFLNFIQDRGVQINFILFGVSTAPVMDWVKAYALLIGCIYTSCMFYKNIIRELTWWKAFAKWNMGLLDAIIDVARQKKEADKDIKK